MIDKVKELKYELIIMNKNKDVNLLANIDMIYKLALDSFPYAILFVCKNFSMFSEFQRKEFRERIYKEIQPIYNLSSDKEIREAFNKIIKNNERDINIFNEKVLQKLTKEMLVIFNGTLYRNKKSIENASKEYYNELSKKINQSIKMWSEFESEAKQYCLNRDIKKVIQLLSNPITQEKDVLTAKNLIENNYPEIFSDDVFQSIMNSCKSDLSIKILCEEIIKYNESIPYVQFFANILKFVKLETFNKPLFHKMFSILNQDQQKDLFEAADKQSLYLYLLRYYVSKYSNVDNIILFIDRFLEKYNNSGEAILKITEVVSDSCCDLPGFPLKIYNDVKKWLIEFSLHSNSNDVVNVIDALAADNVNMLQELTYDFTFWKNMEKSPVFSRIIEVYADINGVENAFIMIRNNLGASKAYGMNKLTLKWIESATNLAEQDQEASDYYSSFILDIIGDNSALNKKEKLKILRILLDELISVIHQKKEMIILEQKRNKSIKQELLNNFIYNMNEPLEKLEKSIIFFSGIESVTNDEFQMIRTLYSKVRKSFEKIGINSIIDPDTWVKMENIPYKKDNHASSNEVAEESLVVAESMGIQFEDYIVKANVHVAEVDDGN